MRIMKYSDLSIKALLLFGTLRLLCMDRDTMRISSEELARYGNEAAAELLDRGYVCCSADGGYRLLKGDLPA